MFIAISKSENIIAYLGCNEDCNILQSDLEKRYGFLRPSPSDTTDKYGIYGNNIYEYK